MLKNNPLKVAFPCALLVYYVHETIGKAGYKSFFYAQVVFATLGMGTIRRLIRSLCNLSTQLSAQVFCDFNGGNVVVLPAIHRTNNKYYKGD